MEISKRIDDSTLHGVSGTFHEHRRWINGKLYHFGQSKFKDGATHTVVYLVEPHNHVRVHGFVTRRKNL